MTTDDQIRDAVFSALRRVAPDADPSTLEPHQKIREVLEIDSYDFLQVLIDLNKRLGIDVPEADYGKLETIAGIISYFRARLG